MGNIVKAVVGKNGKTIKTAPLYQYDYGQILQIEGIELPAAYQVHFSNDPTGDSTTSIGNENGVAIPDTYLASGETVYAWLYLHTGEDDGETVLNIVIPVRQRAAITNETPTPQQQSEIDQLISEMNAAVDEAEDAQAAAEQAAEQAEAQVEKYPVIVDGYWAFWDEDEEQYVKSNQKAQGPKGDPGDPGDPTELIDDTSTGLDKVWSANKSNTLLSAIQEKIDKPTTAGTAGQVLVSDGNGGQVWGTTGQGTIVVDSTMSVSGAAADAAKVGDLKSAIDELKPLGMIGVKYVYNASSGYQNVPITLAAGKYKAINTSSTSATFRDSNNTTISDLFVPHTSAGQYADLTITSEQASEIAYIRLYQGYVEIFPTENILDDIDDINTELTKKADKPIKYTKVPITIESGYRKKNGTTYSSGQHFEVTVNSDVVSYKVSGQHANSDYPFICAYDQSNNETFVYSETAGAVSDYIFVPPAGTTHFYVNANNNGKCASGEDVDILTYFEDAETSLYQLRQDRESRYNLDKKNPFAWKPFDKAYFSWMNDDGRSDMYLYKDLCDTYNIPYANSMPWEVIDANTTVVDGMTVVNYCKQIITDGGEIFTHANNPLTSSSTEADIMQYFRDGKKIIEDAVGCKVSGIIQAGGSGYSTFDYNEGQRFCLAYYEYSDAYGTTPQYTLARTLIKRSSYDSDDAQIAAFKAVVDDAIANHKWVRFYCHGTSEVSTDVLTSVFNYIATKVANGDCAWTTWKNMYDTFRSSSLENRIAAVED